MKFKEIIYEWLLVENKEKVYEKYYSDIDRSTFIRIIKSDPKTIINDQNQIIQFGKHSKLLLDIYRKGELRFEDLVKATDYLTIVYKHNIKLDYKKINSISDIFEYVKHKIPKIAANINEILETLDPEEYNVILDGELWFIVSPKTEKASAYLGVNTEWCTAFGKYSLNPKYKDRECHFSDHNKIGPLYIIIEKSDINNKYQLHFETNQLKNASDNEIDNRPYFFDQKPEVKLTLFPSLSQNNNETIKKDLNSAKKFLSKNDIVILFNKYYEIYGDKDNELSTNFINGDAESILSKIGNDYGLTEISFSDNDVSFEFRKLPNSLDNIYKGINIYQYEKQYSYDNEYTSESYHVNESDFQNTINYYLEEYHKKNITFLRRVFGSVSNSYENFKKSFIKGIAENENVKEGYLVKYAELNSILYDTVIDAELEKFKAIISFDMGYRSFKEVNISLISILDFISDKNITEIADLDDFFDDFTYYHDLPSKNHYPDIEFERSIPDYDFMEKLFTVYFEDLEEKLNDDFEDDEDFNKECFEQTNKLINFVKSNFENGYEFENDFVKIEIESDWLSSFNCKDGVYVTFTNKKTNQKYEGYMQVDSLINQTTMEPLFESIVKKILKEVKRQAK